LKRDAFKLGIAASFAFLGAIAGTAFPILALGALLDNSWLASLVVTALYLGIADVLSKRALEVLKGRDLKLAPTAETLRADARWAHPQWLQTRV
jgi:hypothetical protein